MKRLLLLFVLVCSWVNIFGQLGYRYGSTFIELYPTNSSLYFVQTKNTEQMKNIKERVSSNKAGGKIICNLAENAIIVNSKSLGVGNYVSDIYRDKDGFKLIMLPRLAIKMKDGHNIEEVLTLYGKRLSFDKKEINVCKVNCDVDNAEEILAINKDINLLESVEWCEPMMIGEARKCNEFSSSQYYIKNTGQNGGTTGIDINVEPVWDFLSANTSLIVAVLDDGVERNHEDLNGVVLNGMTIDYPNEYGDPMNAFVNYVYQNTYYSNNKSHGTVCAGIIAAKDNNIGIKGVASGVKILPINIYPYSYPIDALPYPTIWYEKIEEAITWAYNTKGADVISCSWLFSYNSDITEALNNAMFLGRNGKGTVVVCCAGNSGSGVRFPANLTKTIAVGAVDNTGVVWGYSCRGNSLDLVAPSGNVNSTGDIVTTDRMGNAGYNPPTGNITELSNTNYTKRFGGTSAACPQVAGVVALMLSANPNLTMEDVRSILHNTARKLPGMNGQNRTDDYGYGLVNAHTAVFASKAQKIVGPPLISSYGQYHIENLPSGVVVTWSLSDSYYNNYTHLISNSPAPGYCLIFRDEDEDMMNATLTAEIKYNNVTIQTLTKTGLYAYEGFKGQYISGSFSGNIDNIGGSFIIPVTPNCGTIITSPNLLGATVTCSPTATTPDYWAHISSSGELVVIMPTNNNGIPIVFNITDVCGGQYTLNLFAQSSYSINVSNGENGIIVTLNENGDSEREVSHDQSWVVEVCNASTGVLMTTRSSISRSATISTSGWPKDVYVVKVTVGKEVLTEKFIVK